MTSPALLLLQIVAIVSCGRLIGLVFRRFGQPSVIAEIVAGIVVGPSALGWLFPRALDALFPSESIGLLSLMSQVGLVFFMFLVGLEFDPRLLRGRGSAYAAISGASIAVPFLLGIGLAAALHGTYAPHVSFPTFALFMGAAMSITAFPVLARILQDRQILRTRVGSLALACAAVDDAGAWCMLAFVAAFARGHGAASAATMTVLAVVYVLVMVFGVRPLLERIKPAPGAALSPDLVAVVFLGVLCSAVATEAIGIHALFGGFALGVVMPRSGGLAHALGERIQDFVTLVFLPLFFAFSGLRTEIGLLSDPSAWVALGGVVVVACLGKLGGSAVAARIMGLGWRESAAVGVLMNTRGLMSLVVVNIGLDLGVLSPRLFTMLVLMALITTLATSPLLEWIYPSAQMALEMAEESAVPAPEPAPAALVCVADPAVASPLLEVADALTRHRGGAVWALHLLPTDGAADPLPSGAPLDRVRDEGVRRGMDLRALSFPSAERSSDIGRVAELKRVPLVLLGAHGAPSDADPFGGTVRAVIGSTTIAVAVLVDRGLRAVRRVACLDGTDPDGATARVLGVRLAAGGATLTLVASAADVPSDTDLLVMGLSGVCPSTGPSILAVRAAGVV